MQRLAVIKSEVIAKVKAVDRPKAKRKLRMVGIGMLTVIVCLVLVHFGHIWIPRAWGNLKFVNYSVALIPFVLSILFAFVIDKDLDKHVRKMWRISIVFCGLLYSLALWHQQDLTDKSNIEAQKKIVSDAVNQANQHSDEKFASVQKNVGDVKGEVKDLGTSLDTTTKSLTSEVEKTSSALGMSISKVGKPDPPQLAKVQFSFTPVMLKDWPIVQKTLPLNNGAVDISLTLMTTNVMAKGLRVWLRLCTGCKYGKEPTGFQALADIEEPTERTLVVGDFLPRVAYSPTIKFSVIPPDITNRGFLVVLAYACENCSAPDLDNDGQKLTILFPQAAQP
jgi:hypothetical protein